MTTVDPDRSLARLRVFQQGLPGFFRVEDIAAAGTADVLDDAWVVLRRAFADQTQGAWPLEQTGLVDLAGMILAADGDHGVQAFDALVLGTGHPGLFRHLAPLLRTISHEQTYGLVKDGLQHDDPAAVVTTLRFIRAAFGGRFRAPLTASEAEFLDVLVDELVDRDDLTPELRQERAQWIRPAVHPPPPR